MTKTETFRGGHGKVVTWAEITDGEFVRGGLRIEAAGRGDVYLFIRDLDRLPDIVIAAQELHATITERTTDASTEAA